MELVGIAISGVITQATILTCQLTFGYMDKQFQRTYVKPGKSSVYGLFAYLRIGIPSVITLFLDLWAYDLMTIISGLQGVTE